MENTVKTLVLSLALIDSLDQLEREQFFRKKLKTKTLQLIPEIEKYVEDVHAKIKGNDEADQALQRLYKAVNEFLDKL